MRHLTHQVGASIWSISASQKATWNLWFSFVFSNFFSKRCALSGEKQWHTYRHWCFFWCKLKSICPDRVYGRPSGSRPCVCVCVWGLNIFRTPYGFFYRQFWLTQTVCYVVGGCPWENPYKSVTVIWVLLSLSLSYPISSHALLFCAYENIKKINQI